MAIKYSEQYYVEKKRNDDFQGLIFIVTALSLIIYGLIFHWLPRLLRGKREVATLKYKWVFKFLQLWDNLTGCVGVKIPYKKNKFYFQPSLILLSALFIIINGVFCYVETKDLDYEPRFYIVGKRLGRVAVGNFPMLNIMILKHDLLTSITGLQADRLEVMHHWMGRLIWLMVTVHMSLTITYWLDLDFEVMVFIPPQIFGMIAYSTMFLLTWGSMRFIRKWSYDIFLVQHKVLAIIMFLFAFFHNPSNKAAVLIAVHVLVFDRVLTRIIGVIHRRTSPTKGLSDFKILDDDTVEVRIEVKSIMNENKWYAKILPKIGTWKAGQHIYLNVGKVSLFQYHPFTIASLPNTGEIKLIIRKQKRFTKRLMKKLEKVQHDEDQDPSCVKLKVSLWGPYGGKHQPLLTFDSALFVGAGSGASFTFPLALDLLETIRQRNEIGDYLFRPNKAHIKIVWMIRDIRNIEWFKDILNQLAQYVEFGVSIDVYVTQSLAGKLICHDIVEQDPTKETYIKDKTTKEITSKDITSTKEITTEDVSTTKERVQDLGETISSNSSGLSYEASIFDLSNINIHYRRPDVPSLIDEAVSNMIAEDKSSSYKSLAVVGCGPDLLTNQMKEECQKNRWRKHSPDIYCHTEKF